MERVKLTTNRSGLFEITDRIQECIDKSQMEDGIVVLWVPHSTAGLTVISKMDLLGFEDIEDEICRLIPTRVDFKHQFDTPGDAAGHIKSAVIGVSVTCLVEKGRLVLGSSQGIYFFEFDGPRERQVYVGIGGGSTIV